MRIAICGVEGVGKSRYIEGFIKNWPEYKAGNYTKVENIIKTKDLSDLSVQREILDAMTDESLTYKKTADVIFDGSTLDALCHIFYTCAKKQDMTETDIDRFTSTAIYLTKQSLHFYDVLFYIPYKTKFTEFTGDTEVKKIRLEELDNFYLAIQDTYAKNIPWIFPFNDPNGSPPMIEIFGNDVEKIEMTKLYITPQGTAYGKDDSLLQV